MNSKASTRSHTFPHFDWSRTLSMNENRQMDMEEHVLDIEERVNWYDVLIRGPKGNI